MKNKFIETYRDAVMFPYLGFGIYGRRLRVKGLGFWYDKGLYIAIFWTFVFTAAHLNRKVYLDQYKRKNNGKRT